jgi:hypothetical protein
MVKYKGLVIDFLYNRFFAWLSLMIKSRLVFICFRSVSSGHRFWRWYLPFVFENTHLWYNFLCVSEVKIWYPLFCAILIYNSHTLHYIFEQILTSFLSDASSNIMEESLDIIFIVYAHICQKEIGVFDLLIYSTSFPFQMRFL